MIIRDVYKVVNCDDKPTNFDNGSVFVEMNTGKPYFYDAESGNGSHGGE